MPLLNNINLPRTGWAQRYMGLDDGFIQAGVPWPIPRFSDNGDGSVTDNLTGLMWTKDAGTPMVGSYEPGQKQHWWSRPPRVLTAGSCGGGGKNWKAAHDYVTCLNDRNYLAHNDWRLPNINELESIMIIPNYSPKQLSDIKYIFINVASQGYWSSTTCAGGVGAAAWTASLSGAIEIESKTNTALRAWPVRSGLSEGFRNVAVPATGQTQSYHPRDDGFIQAGVPWPIPRFSDNSDGTVTDNLTGLMWTKDANLLAHDPNIIGNLISKARRTSQGALQYILSLNARTGTYGYNDWRLPNVKELRSLVDYSQYDGALPAGHPFTNVMSDYYWSSSPYKNAFDLAWVVNTATGRVATGKRVSGRSIGFAMSQNNDYNKFCVWPVRGGILEGS